MATPRNFSIYKAFAVLKAFNNAEEWLTSSEISRRANLPIASGYRIIQTLEEVGAVVRGPNGRYRPGMLLVSLSHNVAIDDLLRDVSRSVLEDLANRLDVTTHLGILEGGMVTYLSKVCTPTSVDTHTRPGAQLEAYSSGLGKVLLAALPNGEYQNFVLDGDLIALTPHTIIDPIMLRGELDEVRSQGFAVDSRETRIDMYCVAVPIHDNDRHTVAALSITDHARNMSPRRLDILRDALFEAAASLGRKICPDVPRVNEINPHADRGGRRNLAAPALSAHGAISAIVGGNEAAWQVRH